MTIPFRFYSLLEEDQERLRSNVRRCIALLRPCKPLADKLATVGGIFAPLTEDDERLLQAFHEVAQSHQGYKYEGAFDQICHHAGLLPSDAELLGGRVQTLYQEREPVLFEAETYALLHQWTEDEKKGHEP